MSLGLTQPNTSIRSWILLFCGFCVSVPTSVWLWLSLSFFSAILLVWVLTIFSLGLTCLCHVRPWFPWTPSLVLQNVPHKTSLPEGIRVGTVMRIRGVIPEKAGR